MKSMLAISVPAQPNMLGQCRRIVADFAAALGADADVTADLTLAVSEAVSNVIRHAYGSRGGVLRIGAFEGNDRLLVLVTDEGNWGDHADPSAHGGRGLVLMRALAETVDVRRNGGTEVELVFPLKRRRVPAAVV